MNANELIEKLKTHGTAEVLLKVREDWVEVVDVVPTGEHRHAVTITAVQDMGGMSGVIVYMGE